MPRGKIEGQTVAQKLFQNQYECQIQELHRVNDQALREYGHHSTGNSEWDRELMKQWVHVYLTPVRMVEMHSIGANIIISDPKKTVEIYKLLIEHLKNWQHLVEYEFNGIDPPIEDLRMMDDFAGAIWPIASNFMENTVPPTGLLNRLHNLGKGSMSKEVAATRPERKLTPTINRIRRAGQSTTIEDDYNPGGSVIEKKPVERQVHTPIANAIARSNQKRTREWQ